MPIPDHVYSSFAKGAARDALAAQSTQDWQAFLTHRAAELRPGGQLVVVGGAALDSGMSGAEHLMDALDGALRDAVSAGRLTEDEYRTRTIPTWNRTRRCGVRERARTRGCGSAVVRDHLARGVAAYRSRLAQREAIKDHMKIAKSCNADADNRAVNGFPPQGTPARSFGASRQAQP